MSYREFEKRFEGNYDSDDIEAMRESYALNLDGGVGSYTFAVSSEASYLNWPENGFRVTVHATGIRSFCVGTVRNVDWNFFNSHPMLWNYEDSGDIYCNSPVTDSQWMDLIGLTQEALADYGHYTALPWEFGFSLNPGFRKWSRVGSFYLGSFPVTVFAALTGAMSVLGIDHTSFKSTCGKADTKSVCSN